MGAPGIQDSTAKVSIQCQQGNACVIAISVTDSDDPASARVCRGFFLADGMTMDSTNCVLNWTPSAPVGSTFYVKLQVTTPSGGTDAVIAILSVVSSLSPTEATSGVVAPPEGPNPTRGRFALNAAWAPRGTARLAIYDITGRQVAVVRGRPGTQLVWEGRSRGGVPVSPGVYLYRLEVGKQRRDGNVVVMR